MARRSPLFALVALAVCSCGDQAPSLTVDAGQDTSGPGVDSGTVARQYPIQVILNVHNHSPAHLAPAGGTFTDPTQLHCLIRSWLRVADGWLRLAEAPAPAGLSTIKFSFMLDGQFPAWNRYHRDTQAPGGDFCGTAPSYVSRYIDDTEGGMPAANAYIDFPSFIADGHRVGHHTHCQEQVGGVAGYPDELFWTNHNEFECEDPTLADRILGQVHTQIVAAVDGTGTAPRGIHQKMGTLAWRLDHGYRYNDAGFEALLVKNVAHVLWNPHRLCCAGTYDDGPACAAASVPGSFPSLLPAGAEGCDPAAAAIVGIPELAQAGASNAHGAHPTDDDQLFYDRAASDPMFTYGSNNELPQMKKTFWMIFNERRIWERLGLPQRVWTIGWATHDDRIGPAQLRYDSGYTVAGGYPGYDPDDEVEGEGTLPQFYGWVAANFVAPPNGSPSAEFATFDDVYARFVEWEQQSGGAPSVGLNGYEGPSGPYPYQLAFNRLLGPGNVYLDGSRSGNGTLVFDVHDPGPGGYDMSTCQESGPYDYGPMGTGAPVRKPECSTLGAVQDRWIELWTDGDPMTKDVRSLCGGFSGCEDPYVPVLAYDQDDVGAASFQRASAVTVEGMPHLVMCAAACCGSAAACADAGWNQ